ncbi:uncharacterized protein LOC106667013 [Cimex lectularius]|uniref:Transposase Helix-turn-helix domain-containing protein n=1 Tax=Cimex lectularius TaxID=79782 RepID=A0A8I6RUM3_CIMLE|nr:uncharacterized protein LOC106667013 [Cimex lectularius]XP_024084433.1 uncharacterized protein LOC106667013 [Cimex lectularius]
MASYSFNTAEEMRRKNNISKFLEGLLDEEDRTEESGSTLEYPDSPCPDQNNGNGKNKSVLMLDVVQSPIRSGYAQLQYLPSSELVALSAYPELIQENMDNILKIPFSINNIKHSDSLVYIYTGIPAANGFFNLADMLPEEQIVEYRGWVFEKLTLHQQLLLTLMKLKLGLTDNQLAQRFKCRLETVANTMAVWLFAIHDRLFSLFVGMFRCPNMPANFQGPFILHTVTVHVETPKNSQLPHTTPKEPYTGIILTNAYGLHMFASYLYWWQCEKSYAINECNVLGVLSDGDVVAIDREVLDDVIIPEGVVTQPIDLCDNQVLSKRDSLNQRLMEYEIIRSIPSDLTDLTDVIWQVVVTLDNYCHFQTFMN